MIGGGSNSPQPAVLLLKRRAGRTLSFPSPREAGRGWRDAKRRAGRGALELTSSKEASKQHDRCRVAALVPAARPPLRWTQVQAPSAGRALRGRLRVPWAQADYRN